jgi:STE24 endopeptidase
MKEVAAVLILAFVGLFLVTTLPQSTDAQQRAAEVEFTADEIEAGWTLSLQRKAISWVGTFLTLGFLLALAGSRRARRLADRLARWSGQRWWLTVLLMAVFCVLVHRLLLLPIQIISLENWRAWGMTQRDLGSWLLDYLKVLGLTCVIGTGLILALYALIRQFPRHWWLPAAGLAGLVAVGFAFVLPIWIDPLFNTFTPLAEFEGLDAAKRAHLEAAIRDLATRADVPVQEILVKDASRQGSHTNAYFTGFGSTRRIVVFDTLLMAHPPEEVISILAHEIGHWQHNHIVKGLALGLLGATIGLFLLSHVLRWAIGRRPYFLERPSDPAGLPLILLLVFLTSWMIMPIDNAFRRHIEREADWTALELTGRPDVFIDAEKRLARDNKANLVPSPVSVWWFATHPPTLERIEMAREWAALRKKSD